MWKEKGIIIKEHYRHLLQRQTPISPAWEEGGFEGRWGHRHILCPYMGMKFTRSGESSHWSWWMGRRAEGAAKVYIRRERGSRWCEIHSRQIPTEEQKRKGIPLIAFFPCFWPQTTLDHLLNTIKTSFCIICLPPPFFLFYLFYFLPWERRTFKCISMLNNMDLNAKDSFYPQFENCNSSSLGMENSVRKDNQEVYVDAERGVPAQFGHGEFACLHCRWICMYDRLKRRRWALPESDETLFSGQSGMLSIGGKIRTDVYVTQFFFFTHPHQSLKFHSFFNPLIKDSRLQSFLSF